MFFMMGFRYILGEAAYNDFIVISKFGYPKILMAPQTDNRAKMEFTDIDDLSITDRQIGRLNKEMQGFTINFKSGALYCSDVEDFCKIKRLTGSSKSFLFTIEASNSGGFKIVNRNMCVTMINKDMSQETYDLTLQECTGAAGQLFTLEEPMFTSDPDKNTMSKYVTSRKSV